MMIDEKLKLAQGESLRKEGSHAKGFMGETEVTNYSILDAFGNVVGSVEHIEHTAVRGLRVTNSLTQRDSEGNAVVSANW